MGRKNSPASALRTVLLLAALVAPAVTSFVPPALAGDMPLAAGSPLVGFNFDDRPLLLPVQRNFQMAMLTAGSELGRSCGKMEAYGWKMNQAEQQRVDQIFNNTVDRLRGLGYSIETQSTNSVSHDITIFTADRNNKHFLFMWSAGELGLVMTLCESSAPAPARGPSNTWLSPSSAMPQDVVQSKLEAPPRPAPAPLRNSLNFTPAGDWTGDYICLQGYTGATLHINRSKNENFEGVFHFYPTPKNPYIPEGRYKVYGQYDRDSARILINPGAWIQRPKGFYSTVMVGGFDAARGTFSGYFQGVNGCTSFEARYQGHANDDVSFKKIVKSKKKHAKRQKAVKVKTVKANAVTIPSSVTNDAAKPLDIVPTPAVTPAATAAETPTVAAPATVTLTSPTAAPMAVPPTPSATATPAQPVEAVQPTPAVPPTTAPRVDATPAVTQPQSVKPDLVPLLPNPAATSAPTPLAPLAPSVAP
jgi:hypothetical protein